MKISRYFISTIRNNFININNTSVKFMFKAGFINQISSGLYIYFPIFLRIINKLKNFIRKEINKINFIELSLPYIQPCKFWIISNRLFYYNLNLITFNSIKNFKFIISPTNEELITFIVKNKLNNLKKLPISFYQISVKFRDELRCNLGLIRSKEFIMKDGYSFASNLFDLKKIYENVYFIYIKIFNNLNLNFNILLTRDNIMGGYYSHEFYSSNINDSVLYNNLYIFSNFFNIINYIIYFKKIINNFYYILYSPNITDFFLFSNYLKIDIKKFIKFVILISNYINNKILICFLLIKGNYIENFFLFKKNNYIINNRLINNKEIKTLFNVNFNYIGFNDKINVKLLIDNSLNNLYFYILGFNKNNYLLNILKFKFFNNKNFKNKFNYNINKKNIEIAHIFQLGDKYSKLFNVNYLNKNRKFKNILMSCYGIGLTRILSAIIEQNFDKKGIIWPNFISPFNIVICPIGYNSINTIKIFSDKLYFIFKKYNIDVALDDRSERIGVILNDWDLIGVPHKLIISEINLKNKKIEYIFRKFLFSKYFSFKNIIKFILKKIKL